MGNAAGALAVTRCICPRIQRHLALTQNTYPRLYALQVERARRIVNGELQLGGADVNKGPWRHVLGFHAVRRTMKVDRMRHRATVVAPIGRRTAVAAGSGGDGEDVNGEEEEEETEEGDGSNDDDDEYVVTGIFSELSTYFPDEFDMDDWFERMRETYEKDLVKLSEQMVARLKDGSWELDQSFENTNVLHRFVTCPEIKEAIEKSWPDGNGLEALQEMADKGGSLAALQKAMDDTLNVETALEKLPKLFAKTVFVQVCQTYLRGYAGEVKIAKVGDIDLGELAPPSYASGLNRP